MAVVAVAESDFVAVVVVAEPDFVAVVVADPGLADVAPGRVDADRETGDEPDVAAALGQADAARESVDEPVAADHYLKFFHDPEFQVILLCFEAEACFVPEFYFHCLPDLFPFGFAEIVNELVVAQDAYLLGYSFLHLILEVKKSLC